MENTRPVTRRYGKLSYSALIIGIICFFIVFIPPTRIANIGNAAGDYLTMFLTAVGMLLSIVGIASKQEQKWIPIVSLLLSSSFFIFWAIVIVLLFTGQMDFAP